MSMYPSKGTKAYRFARQRMLRNLRAFDEEAHLDDEIRKLVPDAWRLIEEDLDCAEPKVKITLRLDASVAKMFRAMGDGYQARINRILALWLQMRIVKANEFEGYVRGWDADARRAEPDEPQK